MRIVLRIGGSVIASPTNTELIEQYSELLLGLKRDGHAIAIVVGGGTLAREFIKIAKELTLNERSQDELAILVSRIYARLFVEKLGKFCCGRVSENIDHAIHCIEQGKIAVMGGLKPGMTTDAVAATLAEKTKADLMVKGTDQEGIYDRDPRLDPNAQLIAHLRFEDLNAVLSEKEHKAGIHQIIDPEAVKILKHGHLKVLVVNGFKPQSIHDGIRGKQIGTLIE